MKKKKTVAKTNKQRDEKNQVNCDGKHCCKKKIKHFISLESNIQLEERNYFGCNFRISVHIFSFCQFNNHTAVR